MVPHYHFSSSISRGLSLASSSQSRDFSSFTSSVLSTSTYVQVENFDCLTGLSSRISLDSLFSRSAFPVSSSTYYIYTVSRVTFSLPTLVIYVLWSLRSPLVYPTSWETTSIPYYYTEKPSPHLFSTGITVVYIHVILEDDTVANPQEEQDQRNWVALNWIDHGYIL